MIYVDPAGSAPGCCGRIVFCCHMFADSVEELVAFAERIGLKRSWLQGTAPGKVPHFDLTEGKRWQALDAGASDTSRERTVAIWKRLRGDPT